MKRLRLMMLNAGQAHKDKNDPADANTADGGESRWKMLYIVIITRCRGKGKRNDNTNGTTAHGAHEGKDSLSDIRPDGPSHRLYAWLLLRRHGRGRRGTGACTVHAGQAQSGNPAGDR